MILKSREVNQSAKENQSIKVNQSTLRVHIINQAFSSYLFYFTFFLPLYFLLSFFSFLFFLPSFHSFIFCISISIEYSQFYTCPSFLFHFNLFCRSFCSGYYHIVVVKYYVCFFCLRYCHVIVVWYCIHSSYTGYYYQVIVWYFILLWLLSSLMFYPLLHSFFMTIGEKRKNPKSLVGLLEPFTKEIQTQIDDEFDSNNQFIMVLRCWNIPYKSVSAIFLPLFLPSRIPSLD